VPGDLGQRVGILLTRPGHPDDVTAGGGQLGNLLQCRVEVMRLVVGGFGACGGVAATIESDAAGFAGAGLFRGCVDCVAVGGGDPGLRAGELVRLAGVVEGGRACVEVVSAMPSQARSQQAEELIKRAASGESKTTLAKAYNISRETVYSYLRAGAKAS
jgi:hypothetical protein